jgi:transposase IS116/IS110/IS902 family protein
VIASALRARVTDAKLFENGRHLSAWIGIVPENDSTGGKVKQKGLSKKGDRYLRSLLNGAMAVVRQAQRRPDKHPWVAMKQAFSSNNRFSHHGIYWHLDNVLGEPQPAQRPRRPFGSQPATLALSAGLLSLAATSCWTSSSPRDTAPPNSLALPCPWRRRMGASMRHLRC